jgi:chromosome partitioning protein
MKVFAVANGKGGVGKTTTAANFGVNLSKRDYYTVFVDTDPHASLQEWWEARKDGDPQLLSVHISQLGEALPRLREAGVEFLVIDTPGFVHEEINEALKLADLIIIPSKASPLDLRATRKTILAVEECGVPMVFVLNEVRKGTRIANESVLALSQHGKLAPIIHYKNDFVTSMIDGRTIDEVASPDNPGIDEVDKLTEYLLLQVGIKNPKPVVREAVPATAKPARPGESAKVLTLVRNTKNG